jgi:hypothetical protein
MCKKNNLTGFGRACQIGFNRKTTFSFVLNTVAKARLSEKFLV